MKHITEKKGYITLEAAIILPVFMLAVVSIFYYIAFFSIIENVAYCSIEETAKLASKASVVKVAPGFVPGLENRIISDNPQVKNLDTESFRYLYWDGDTDNMISVTEKYFVELKLPMGFDHTASIESKVKCRGFAGRRVSGTPMTFDEMEMVGEWNPVWIFPMSGEKYHSPDCTYVKANAREMVLTDDLERRFGPCSLCSSDELSKGSYVYCFMENGTVYHRSDCSQVDKYAVEVNKEEAQEKGYSPCSKCGGG